MQYPTPITEAMFKILEYVKNNDVKHLNINLKKQKNNPNLYHHLKHFNETLEEVKILDIDQLIKVYQFCMISCDELTKTPVNNNQIKKRQQC